MRLESREKIQRLLKVCQPEVQITPARSKSGATTFEPASTLRMRTERSVVTRLLALIILELSSKGDDY